ncbi:MAG: ATP-binding protein [Myxococcota bacterium]|nr:ATP-binding protein [Myxococcota bacterium]
MALIVGLLASLERVLAQLERLLGLWLPDEPAATDFGRNIAFRWEARALGGVLVPIAEPRLFDLDDLVGVEASVQSLDRNTRQFMAGMPFNNVLLYGERGTGKSSAVRGLLARHSHRGLRMIEVDRKQLTDLPRLMEWLRGRDEYHFLIACDDLSFGPGESGHRELKTALEGSLQPAAAHVMIVATSNRRHLIPEFMAENREAGLDEEGELHLGESLDEKLALADRFGLVLGFFGFDQKTYLEIVSRYLTRAGFSELDDLTREAALRWALIRGNRSGRTARQFVDDLVGQRQLQQVPAEDEST